MRSEETLRKKADVGKISERAKILRVDCGLEKEDAVNIMRRCRTLEEIVFGYNAFNHTEEEALEYLNRWVYLEKR
ncbi:MAG: hypothetical protein R6U26_01535 [Candidatus Undinarchaeales archaeon]